MPKYKHGSGSVYKRGKTWWIGYIHNGSQVCESAKTTDKAEARRILQTKLGQIAEDRYIGPAAERVTFEELAEMVLVDYQVNGKRSLRELRIRLAKHLLPVFGEKKAKEISTEDIQEYILARQEQGASNAEVNRETAIVKRAFNLALRAERIHRKPYIPHLEENNIRQGFFEPWEFTAILARLPEYLRPPMSFAYSTGWRRGEILSLTWDRVEREEGAVRLYRGTTKNKDGRLIYLTQELRAVLAQQWQNHREQYPACPYVFHRDGQRIKDLRGAWERACKESGLAGKIPHDFRRSAVRNMVRAGIPERVAMMISGHRTRDVFDRYNIVSEGDLKEATRRLEATFTPQVTTKSTTIPLSSEQEPHLTH
jgi:integrase